MQKLRSTAIACLCTCAGLTGFTRAAELEVPRLTLDSPILALDAAASRDATAALKHPVDWFTWGADERLRIEYFDNAITLNQAAPGHEWDFFRYRTRIWTSITPAPDLQFNARLIWEGRHWNNPQQNSEHTGPAYKPEWDNGQGVFDTLNVRFTVPQIDTTLTAGRQDIILGDGWLVLEGTPLDGSTSIYFDAIRATTTLKEIQTTADLIYINQYSSPDIWLPTINDTDRAQIENNERGAILWLTNKSLKNTEINPYFIYKHDRAAYSLAKGGDNADLYTFGTRVVEDFTPNLKGRVEVAGQFGDKDAQSVCAWGMNSRLGWCFRDPMNNELRFNFEYLSGDNPGTATNEAFDPLWGRWPQWSELYVYTYAKETRIANTTNLLRVGPAYLVRPTSAIELELGYNALFANQNTLGASPGYTDDGNFRGHLFDAIFRYKINEHLSGHFWSEYLVPGNYYDDSKRDNAVYLRAELVMTF